MPTRPTAYPRCLRDAGEHRRVKNCGKPTLQEDSSGASVLALVDARSNASNNREARTMALGIYFAQSGLDVDKYNECIKRLKKAGAGHPVGRSYHSSFGPADKLMIFDVWTSQAAFDKIGRAHV